ncbi:hypothetical protein GA0070622_0896 [Micromonospora sediminicola]|uniref:HK97 gp10 family phage protein n=1 Tax=Micromonospora sediminicola TaxID=946078 RepID=A0A1A9B486_9ACTN|nr:hypothetical protein [Micromonospora sediminicola]SBT63928.1 hypothetical protein GA0070622_0896 [Micromonospora sediminicola]
MNIDLDASDVNRLRAHLEQVPADAHRNLVKATEFSARGIKDTSREFASGLAHAPDYPQAITYDVDDRGAGDGVAAEIGPEKERRQGALGNILEYGTINNPPYAHLGPALDIWTPDWEHGLEKAAADALDGRT